MANGYDYKKFALLYVDDEEQSLKYFHKSYDKDFRVLTAPSVAAARTILDREGDSVGVVMTDQRMPGKTGVDLLGHLREARPGIVRILTTAYSDIESAIDAVNSGAIYKYVVKPWNLRDLRGTLLRASEFFIVQRERDLLFREKLSVIQRLILIDRVRSLAALAAGLSHHVRNSMQALSCFIDLAPAKLREELPEASLKNPEFWGNLWSLAQKDGERILHMLQQVALTVAEPDYRFADDVDLNDLLAEAASEANEAVGQGRVALDVAAGLPHLKVDLAMLRRLFTILITRAAKMSAADGRVVVSAKNVVPVWGTPGVQIFISCEGRPWTDDETASLFTAFSVTRGDVQELGLDLLSAFFITYHHGGDIRVHKSIPGGPGFELRLPFSPGQVDRPDFQDNLLEKLFTHFDAWDAAKG
jgi:two-component system probable response regulator PhcQ